MERSLWKALKPHFDKWGKFQKLSDRFTTGVPDVIGVSGCRAMAIEFKESKFRTMVKVKFRPGQIQFLHEWVNNGGYSQVVVKTPRGIYIFNHAYLATLEREGIPFDRTHEYCRQIFPKDNIRWDLVASEILNC